MSENYITHNVYLEAADFYVLIIEFPEEDINDKLTLLAPERGLIYKHFYEDFVIGTCMANTGPFFYHVRRRPELLTKFADIRKEVLGLVYKYSPGFDPQNIVVNQNNVLKTKGSVSSAGEKVRQLINNDLWDQDPPLSSFGPAVITNAPIYDGDDNPFLEDESGQEGSPPLTPPNPFNSSGPPGDGDVPYELVGHRWDRVGVYLNVRKYEPTEESLLTLLGAAPFESVRGYHLLVVASCIEDYADVFHLLETLGVSKKTAPDVLMEELYNIALIYNGFLKLEDINLKDIRQKHKDKQASRQRNNKQASAATTADRMVSTGKIKKFSDVSKERLLKLPDLLKERIIGQNTALESISDAIQRASVGLKRPHEPLGVFMFMGNTGMGKSETAKVLAEILDAHLVRIDCQEYQQSHEPAKLTGCFAPGTPILMGDGSICPIEQVSVLEEVISHTGNKRKVLETFDYDYKGKLIEFKSVGSNVPIQVTPNHEIPVIKTSRCSHKGRGHVVCKPTCFRANHQIQTCSTQNFTDYQLQWLPAKDLEIGDIVLYPRYRPNNEVIQELDLAELLSDYPRLQFDDKFVWAQPEVEVGNHHKIPRRLKIDYDFMRLAGYYVSEGGKNNKSEGINFTFHYNEKEYQEEVSCLVDKLFGLFLQFKRPVAEELVQKKRKRGYVCSKILGLTFSKLFGSHTREKRLPTWFMDLPNDLIQEFLTTAVFRDGTVAVKRRVSYKTISFTLHSQMKLLFSRLGFITQTQRTLGKGNNQTCYNLLVGGEQVVRMSEEFSDLNIDLGGFTHSDIQRMSYIDQDYVYSQIKSKTYVDYTGKVYDFKVDQDTSYVVHNFAVHNSPPGYIGYEDGGQLTKEVSKNPFSVVLFDEIEKAHSTFHERILQIIDDGILTDNKGKKVSFSQTIIIMTSNIGVQEVESLSHTLGFGDVSVHTETKSTKAREEALKKKFKPEFLNRIDEILHFRLLTQEDYILILDILLKEVTEQVLINRGILLTVSASAKNFLLAQGIDKKFGARPLRRCIKKYLNSPLAKEILRDRVADGGKVQVVLGSDKSSLVFRSATRAKKEEESQL